MLHRSKENHLNIIFMAFSILSNVKLDLIIPKVEFKLLKCDGCAISQRFHLYTMACAATMPSTLYITEYCTFSDT